MGSGAARWLGEAAAQQWLLESVLRIEPLPEGSWRSRYGSQDERWAANLAAARQFHAREGHLRVPRKHVETVDGVEHKLGAFVDNARRRASRLAPERRAELDALGMRW
ncbi:helicase associated domain-containing protein [Streptomyces sp. NPDC014006]|uniref:helicase associated domain-containing protein n=1 Tax=Streptomyces sp. NPDC014006 TaxID=3364870 RepID=UPI0036F5D449